MIVLTDEQVLAATAPERLVNIVSAPGSGKTTVASERFGYQRYSGADRRGVLGLTFNRAAAAELSGRVASRWGSGCLSFPHRVATFDSLHVTMLERLLRAGLVSWPGGYQKLDVRDDYRGEQGFRFLRPPNNWRRVAGLSGARTVVSGGVRVSSPTSGIGGKDDHVRLLSAGISSHDDVRSVMLAAMKVEELREHAAAWLASNFRALVIDEVYDAAILDLHVAYMAAESGLSVTLIGDPWQALYGWRGATPDQVEKLRAATTEEFVDYDQSISFRFSGRQMPALAAALRSGQSVAVPAIDSAHVDVALARWWRGLWHAGDNVLPLAFRTIENATDASLNLLLDVVTRAQLGVTSYGRETAITQLGLDRGRLRVEQDQTLRPLLADLKAGTSPATVLDRLRGAIVTLGAPRRPRRLQESKEADREAQLRVLAIRLHQPTLIPGLTVYQAKGQEWARVGVVLSHAQKSLLSTGLKELEDEHCVVYVALTRAKNRCGLLAEDLTLDIETDEPPSL